MRHCSCVTKMASLSYGGSTAKGNISSILSLGHVVDTIRKPQVIVRLATMVVCIVIFGCIADNGADSNICFINKSGKQGPCVLGLFVGVMGFLICLGFLAIDFLFELSNNIYVRKWFVIADLAVSALWSFFSLVAFAYMTDQWRNNKVSKMYPDKIVNAIKAAITFSFFAIIGFGILTGLAAYRLRLGSGALLSHPSEIPGGSTAVPPVQPTPPPNNDATPTEPSD